MLSIRTVLCPVDFSASTARQVELAVDLCRAFGARLILQHNKVELAIGAGVGWMFEPSHAGSALTPEEQLKEMLARVPAGTDAEMRLTRGPIVDAVMTVSRAVGHVCIGVQIASQQGVRVLTDILKQHGGHLISYFSVGSVQHLSG